MSSSEIILLLNWNLLENLHSISQRFTKGEVFVVWAGKIALFLISNCMPSRERVLKSNLLPLNYYIQVLNLRIVKIVFIF